MASKPADVKLSELMNGNGEKKKKPKKRTFARDYREAKEACRAE